MLTYLYSGHRRARHICVPHSHCDPGWWKTFEEYYQQWGKGIISALVDALDEDDTRRCIWAEISFFERWWQDQKPAKRDVAKR